MHLGDTDWDVETCGETDSAGEFYDFAWEVLRSVENFESPEKERLFVRLCLEGIPKRLTN